MIYVNNTMNLAEKQKLEVASMEQEKQAAILDYIAMMTDVDLSCVTDDTTEGGVLDAE